jgi:hypothetical protein
VFVVDLFPDAVNLPEVRVAAFGSASPRFWNDIRLRQVAANARLMQSQKMAGRFTQPGFAIAGFTCGMS